MPQRAILIAKSHALPTLGTRANGSPNAGAGDDNDTSTDDDSGASDDNGADDDTRTDDDGHLTAGLQSQLWLQSRRVLQHRACNRSVRGMPTGPVQ